MNLRRSPIHQRHSLFTQFHCSAQHRLHHEIRNVNSSKCHIFFECTASSGKITARFRNTNKLFPLSCNRQTEEIPIHPRPENSRAGCSRRRGKTAAKISRIPFLHARTRHFSPRAGSLEQ